MSKNTIEIIINQTGNAVKGIGAVAGLFTGLASSAMGAIGPVVEIGKAVFEIGNAGAKVAQTKASFDGLGVSLDALKKASGGTVDDMTLMSSTLTLMAGSTGELNAAFAEAAPGLMEMAKAAAKLNPSLGDTTSMYESLALGIKRGSPLILDNLGIIVSQEKANKDYAAAIGKTVAQLTEEEKKIALLNATMESGNILLEQAGGNTASATDGFDRFKASLSNYTDEVKSAYAGTGGLFDALAGGLDTLAGFQQKWTEFYGGLLGIVPATDTASASLGVLEQSMLDAIAAADFSKFEKFGTAMGEAMETTATKAGEARDAMGFLTGAIPIYKEAQDGAISTIDKAVDAFNRNKEAIDRAKDAYYDLNSTLLESTSALDGNVMSGEVYKASVEAIDAAVKNQSMTEQEGIAAKQALMEASGALTDSEKTAMSTIESLTASLNAGKMSPEAYAIAIGKVQDSIDRLQDKTVTITVEMRGDAQAIANAGAAVNAPGKGEAAVAMQSGFNGIFTRPTMAIFGEGGPEQVTAQPLSNVTNNYNLSVSAMAAASSVVDDFNMMRAFAGRP